MRPRGHENVLDMEFVMTCNVQEHRDSHEELGLGGMILDLPFD